MKTMNWMHGTAGATLAAGLWLIGLSLGSGCLSTTDTGEVCAGGTRCPADLVCMEFADGPRCVEDGACGDGVVQPSRGEMCDDGNELDGDGCSADCGRLVGCGDGFVNVGEVCDDGNVISGDGCSANCLSDETCGNGHVDVEAGEDCDCGAEGSGVEPGFGCADRPNNAAGGLCNPTCRLHCGDGDIAPEEVCDVSVFRTGEQCANLGYDHGHLACSADCGGWDASDCGSFGWTSVSLPSVASNVPVLRLWGSASDNIFAVGWYGTLMHFAGTGWVKVPLPTLDTIVGLWGSGPNDVFAVSAHGVIWHHDGRDWDEIVSIDPTGVVVLQHVWGSGPDDIFAVGLGGVIRHYDGTGWPAMNSGTTETLYGVWGSGPDNVFAVGAGGTILHYDGSGSDWTAVPNVPTMNTLYAIWGSGPDDIFAVGEMGTVLRSDGNDWTAVQTFITATLNAVWGSGPDDVFIAGESGVILRYDGNAATGMASPTTEAIYGLWGSGSDDIFAADHAGKVWSYSGVTWQEVVLYPGSQFTSLWTPDDHPNHVSGLVDAFVVGTSGVIFHRGSTMPTVRNLNGVWGSAIDDVFAVGDRGTVVHYNGTSWTDESPGTVMDFHGVWGSGADDIFAVGEGGTVGHYNGNDWGVEALSVGGAPVAVNLNGVWGSGPDDVFAVGDGGTIVHRDGADWTSLSTPTNQNLRAVWGTGPADVFAVGDSGTALHYDGASWTETFVPVSDDLRGVHGRSPTDVLAVGTGQTLLEYNGSYWAPVRLGGFGDFASVFALPASGQTTLSIIVGGVDIMWNAGGLIHTLTRESGTLRVTARPSLLIPDNAYDGTPDSMACVDIGAPALPVREVAVTLGIEHSRVGDLTVKLVSPQGELTTLLSRPGVAELADDGLGAGGAEASLSADAPITFRTGGANDAELMGQGGEPVCVDDGRCEYAPAPGAGPGAGLTAFAGENGFGVWQVCVGDSRSGRIGFIATAALSFDGELDAGSVMCGNGRLEYGEQCDDGNTTANDGCAADCYIEQCGDGVVQPGAGETCDDDNVTSGDGCSRDCVIEVCGDGIDNNVDEECDDGNVVDGDGCTSTCEVELPPAMDIAPGGMLTVQGLFDDSDLEWNILTNGCAQYALWDSRYDIVAVRNNTGADQRLTMAGDWGTAGFLNVFADVFDPDEIDGCVADGYGPLTDVDIAVDQTLYIIASEIYLGGITDGYRVDISTQ